MVKGVSRRVVVIKSPEGNIFEQAIFILKEGRGKDGVTSGDIIKEACAVASDYLRQNGSPSLIRKLPAPVFAALGAAITAAVWLATVIF